MHKSIGKKRAKKKLMWLMQTLQMVQCLLTIMGVTKSGVRIMKENRQPKSNWLGRCEILVLLLVIN